MAPGALQRCVPVSFNISLLWLRLAFLPPSITRPNVSVLAGGPFWEILDRLESDQQGFQIELTCTCQHRVTYPVETPTVSVSGVMAGGLILHTAHSKDIVSQHFCKNSIIRLKCKGYQVSLSACTWRSIIFDCPQHAENTADAPNCTDSSINTVGKHHTISVSVPQWSQRGRKHCLLSWLRPC